MLSRKFVLSYNTTGLLCLLILAFIITIETASMTHEQREAYRQIDVLLSIQSGDESSFDQRNVYVYLNKCYNLLRDTLSDVRNDRLDAEDGLPIGDMEITSESVKLMKSLINLYDLIIYEDVKEDEFERQQVGLQFNALIREISLKVVEFEQDLSEQVAHIGRYLVTLVAIKEDNNARNKMVTYKDKRRNKARAKGKTGGRSFWTVLLRKIFEQKRW